MRVRLGDTQDFNRLRMPDIKRAENPWRFSALTAFAELAFGGGGGN
jgi:hypothetical protein